MFSVCVEVIIIGFDINPNPEEAMDCTFKVVFHSYIQLLSAAVASLCPSGSDLKFLFICFISFTCINSEALEINERKCFPSKSAVSDAAFVKSIKGQQSQTGRRKEWYAGNKGRKD